MPEADRGMQLPRSNNFHMGVLTLGSWVTVKSCSKEKQKKRNLDAVVRRAPADLIMDFPVEIFSLPQRVSLLETLLGEDLMLPRYQSE